MTPYGVVLADDHVLIRQGIRRIIQEHQGLEVIGEARDGLELLDFLKTAEPALVLLDINMPRLSGLEVSKIIKTRYPQIKILMLTMYKNQEYLHVALEAGVEGYLLKEDADTELIKAINTIRSGRNYVSALLSQELTDLLVTRNRTKRQKTQPELLTGREKEIVQLITIGQTNLEIAEALFISVRTVQHHRANIMRKLKLKNTVEMVRFAIHHGLVGLQH
ncbi:MAG: DNA-binding response regulator [Desulfobacca sp. 4484_104]|nr:MAG: DNA-binding response regulator [Desulfobacca sp. 4484_104]